MTATVLNFNRHWDVFKAALQTEQLEAHNKRHYSDTTFLPAALEVIETPPSPIGRMMLMSLSAMVVIAVVWSIFGKIDIVAVAPGKIIPAGRVKIIQWGGSGGGSEGVTGVVRAVHVAEGQRVKAGQLLIELDPTITGADEAQANRGLLSANIEGEKERAIVSYLTTGRYQFTAPENTPADVVQNQRALIQSTIAEYEAKRATLDQTQAEKQSELQTAILEQEKLRDTLRLLEQQVAARSELAEKGYGSKLQLWQIQEQLIERKKNLSMQSSIIAKARAGISAITQQRAQLKQELSRGSLAGLAKAQDDASVRTQEQAKARQRQTLTRITAPVDGIITQLAVNTVGGVIQAAQPLMTIVPQGSELIIEANIQNKDIGFVRKGQAVHVKLEAYPFTQYGLIDGTLDQISADAVPLNSDANEKNTGKNNQAGLTYITKIKLNPLSAQAFIAKICGTATSVSSKQTADNFNCAQTVMTSGMIAQAEIKTGQRRIAQYILSPVAKVTSEAGRER
jgi:hemolysin D